MRLAAVVLVVAASAGCASTWSDVDVTYDEVPPPLAIAGPHEGGLVYNLADDEDPRMPGIQLTLRVDVKDEAIDRVSLALDQRAPEDDVVGEDLEGRRAAFFTLDIAAADNPVNHAVIARAPAADVEVRAVLVAAAAAAP